MLETEEGLVEQQDTGRKQLEVEEGRDQENALEDADTSHKSDRPIDPRLGIPL